jgi:hypothetical protein
MTRRDLLNRLEDQPFSPFRVHVSDGAVLEVRNPGMVIVGLTTAVLPTVWGKDEDGLLYPQRWRTVALAHLTQFSDIATSNGKRRKRK